MEANSRFSYRSLRKNLRSAASLMVLVTMPCPPPVSELIPLCATNGNLETGHLFAGLQAQKRQAMFALESRVAVDLLAWARGRETEPEPWWLVL